MPRGTRSVQDVRGSQHHIQQAKYGAIQYTEPFLNNQHVTEPTWFYLTRLASASTTNDKTVWRDVEGNVLLTTDGTTAKK